jgi:hypothetical protein
MAQNASRIMVFVNRRSPGGRPDFLADSVRWSCGKTLNSSRFLLTAKRVGDRMSGRGAAIQRGGESSLSGLQGLLSARLTPNVQLVRGLVMSLPSRSSARGARHRDPDYASLNAMGT